MDEDVIALVSLPIHDSCSTLSFISLSFISLIPFTRITFLFSSHTITMFLPLYFSSFSFMIHTKQQGNKIVISHLDKAHCSYCRHDGPATFVEQAHSIFYILQQYSSLTK